MQQSPTIIKQSYNSKLTDLLEYVDILKLQLMLASNGLYSCRRNMMYAVIISVTFRE